MIPTGFIHDLWGPRHAVALSNFTILGGAGCGSLAKIWLQALQAMKKDSKALPSGYVKIAIENDHL